MVGKELNEEVARYNSQTMAVQKCQSSSKETLWQNGGIEHEKIMKKVKKMMDTDPMELLERDRHLLLTEDFEQLGQAPSSYREYWVAEMETTIESSAKTKRQTTIDHNGKLITRSTHSEPPVIDTEGSIRYHVVKSRQC